MGKITQSYETKKQNYEDVVEMMYHNPEIGLQEYKAQEALCNILSDEGFQVEKGVTLETDFIAVYDSFKEGPNIAFLCEYDALPKVGHGCGHNLIAGISLAAGIALKDAMQDLGGKVYVMGTPAEETFGGKITMAEKGCFKDIDVAMMIHPSNKNYLGGKTLAMNPIKYEFFGRSAHACEPEEGHSALDAAISFYNQVSMLRQFTKPLTFIHGIIRDGGGAANVIPEYASMEYYFRAPKMSYVMELSNRAETIAKACADAHLCTYKSSIFETPFDDCLINYTLANALKVEYEKLGMEDVGGVDETPNGSSDIGAVSYVCPSLHGYIKIAPLDVNGHSCEMAAATIDEVGKKALHDGAISLGEIGYRLLSEPEFLQAVKQEFEDAMQ